MKKRSLLAGIERALRLLLLYINIYEKKGDKNEAE